MTAKSKKKITTIYFGLPGESQRQIRRFLEESDQFERDSDKLAALHMRKVSASSDREHPACS